LTESNTTVRYGDGPDQLLEIWPGAGVPVLFLHGGFWRARYDRSHARPLAADLARHGYRVFLAEYRRIGQPGGGYPGTLDDALSAARTVVDLAGPPVLAGHSAGGHLALWLAGRVPSRGVLALAPVADLAEGYRLGLSSGAVGELLGGAPDEVPDRYADADPMAHLPAPVPVTVVHGDADDTVPVDLGRRYVAAAGGAARLVELPGVDHYAVITPGSGAWPAVLAELATLAGPPGVDGGRQTG
jgi:acetyl esterase/lipase